VVWSNSISGGYLTNLSSLTDSGVPASRAFFLGGRQTIRGFEPSNEKRVPSEQELANGILNYNVEQDFYVTRFSSMYLLKSELRYPIYGNIGGTIFYDGGSVLVDTYRFEDSYRDSAGFGLHYLTPVGPISIDLGIKLDRKTSRNESPYVLHFSFVTF
jgi:outer membrane protein assembly factor BamA